MMPVVFTIPGINYAIPGFGFALMIGFLWAIWWAANRASKSGGNPDVVLNLGFVALVGGVVGCRLMYVAHYWERDFANRGSLLETLFAIVDVSRGGMEFYGGLLTATLLAIIWIVRYEKVSLRWYLDIVAPSVVLGLAVGRVGCLLNGCCYGSTCDGPQAMRFPYGSSASAEQWQARLPESGLPRELLMIYPPGIPRPLSRESLAATDEQIAAAIQEEKAARQERDEARAAEKSATGEAKKTAERRASLAIYRYSAAQARYMDIRRNMEKYKVSAAEIRALAARHMSLPVHPTQIYSTITAGLLALFLSALYWRRTRDGQVIATMFVIEPITRYVLEVIRADNPIDTVGSFTISQFISLCLVPIGLVMLLVLQTMPPRSSRAQIWVPPPEEKPKAAAATA
ncbi:MAG: prolipoprotein diacylglyceryl transferase family protein [Phycisphaerae bacterium]